MTAVTWQAALARLDDASPAAGRLARLASLALRVEPRLLRRLRLRFVGGDASCESDVWFSPLVAVRDSDAFTWAPGAADVLRAGLAAVTRVDPAEVRAEIAEVHAGAPPLLQLEEEIAWLAVRGAPRAELERALGRAVRAFQDHPASAEDLAAWAVHALPGLPEAARGTAAAWQLRLAAASRFGSSPALGVPAPDDLLSYVVRGVLADRGRQRLRVVRDAERLWLEASPDGAAGDDSETMTVPSTRPLWVEASSDGGRRRSVIAVEPGQRAALDAAGGDVLRNALGEAWVLESARVAALGAEPDAELDADDVLFGWVIVRLPPEAPEGWSEVRDQVLGDLARSAARAGRVDLVILLADHVPLLDRRPALEAISRELGDALGPAATAMRILVSPVTTAEPYGSGERSADDPVVEATPARGVRMIIRTDDRPAAWPIFAERVTAAMQGWDSKDAPADLVFAIGRDAARLAERRFPVTVPLLILDDASPWLVPAPGVRLPGSPALWSARPSPPRRPELPPWRASYGLGCVRRSFPATEKSPPAARLTAVERSWIECEWRERASQSTPFDLQYPGDRDLGWARGQIVVVIGDPGRDGFVEALREWRTDGNPLDRESFLVVERGDSAAAISTRLHALAAGARARIWLFVREQAAADQVEAVIHELGKIGPTDLLGFVDREDVILAPRWSNQRSWIAVATASPSASQDHADTADRPTSAMPITSAGLEALLGAARRGNTVQRGALHAHLDARLPRPPDILISPATAAQRQRRDHGDEEVIAPAPKRARLDTSAMRRVFGGTQRESGRLPPEARIEFLTGRNAASRSAWLDRWLRSWIGSDETKDPPAILGWTPRLQTPDALLAHCRNVLVDWGRPQWSLADADEVAWRIEGSNALLILDGLGMEATRFERHLIDACSHLRAGMLVVSTPHIAGWMHSIAGAARVDLDELPRSSDLTRGTRLDPTAPGWVAAWLEQLATWGDDRPVLVAIELSRATLAAAPPSRDELVAAGQPPPPSGADGFERVIAPWLNDGDPQPLTGAAAIADPTPADRIAAFTIQAALALSDGDPERMMTRVRDAVELASELLGAEQCARVLGIELTGTAL